MEGNCYLISPTNLTWWQAEQFCGENGGHLAEVQSAEEERSLWGILDSRHNKAYWLGLTDLAYEGRFEWQYSYKPLISQGDDTWVNWFPGQPDNDGGREDCVLSFYKEGSDWKWNDAPCDMFHADWSIIDVKFDIYALCQAF